MTIEEILKGEGKNVEFKRELPKQSERYIKSVVAFANTAGGKIIIGIEDETQKSEIKALQKSSIVCGLLKNGEPVSVELYLAAKNMVCQILNLLKLEIVLG